MCEYFNVTKEQLVDITKVWTDRGLDKVQGQTYKITNKLLNQTTIGVFQEVNSPYNKA